jgi:hypothetical protein
LVATPEELAKGNFSAYEKFDWQSRYAAVGIDGNFERYHLGNDLDKIRELSGMLQDAFIRISKRKKARFDCELANEIVIQTTHTFEEIFSEK